MHEDYLKANALSGRIIGAAIEVHRHKGPGLIESIYERCLMRELELLGIDAVNQLVLKIEYKGLVFEEPLRVDVYAEHCLVVENKVVEKILPIHKAQLFSYMKLLDAPNGLLFNFHEPVLKNGIVRLILARTFLSLTALVNEPASCATEPMSGLRQNRSFLLGEEAQFP